jgi:hypothetical protein
MFKWPIMPNIGDTERRVRGSLVDFSFEAVTRSPPLKLVPASGRVIVLAAERVRIHIYRCSDGRVPQPFRYHWQRHAIGYQVGAVAMAQGVQTRSLGKSQPAEQQRHPRGYRVRPEESAKPDDLRQIRRGFEHDRRIVNGNDPRSIRLSDGRAIFQRVFTPGWPGCLGPQPNRRNHMHPVASAAILQAGASTPTGASTSLITNGEFTGTVA